jgi:hypothetical protein
MYDTPIKGSINIMGTKIDIIIDDYKLLEYDADGLYHDNTIYLKSEYEDIKHYLTSYRHEAIHALCDILGVQLDDRLEEILAHRISTMITEEL